MSEENYITNEEIESLCEKEGCHCPPIHTLKTKLANTPMFLRVYFEERGRRDAMVKYAERNKVLPIVLVISWMILLLISLREFEVSADVSNAFKLIAVFLTGYWVAKD